MDFTNQMNASMHRNKIVHIWTKFEF